MSTLWVFGYGSLIWNPGFEFSECKVGKISGYSRLFWQGSDCHRGDPNRMGRVVTLVEEEGVSTWGRAFQFTDEASTLAYLGNRESSLGGYSTIITQFYPRDPKEEPFPVLVYIALPCNPLFLGTAPLEQIAKDIASSEGQCGHNVEYLAKLAAFMRNHLPNVWDDHLFSLENLVRKVLHDFNPKLLKLFEEAFLHDIQNSDMFKSVVRYFDTNSEESNYSSTPTEITFSSSYSSSFSSSSSSGSSSEMPSRYTDRVPSRKLRCINK